MSSIGSTTLHGRRPSFDGVAWAYDAFMRGWRLYKDRAVAAALDLGADESLVDIGGGTGHYAAMLAPLCSEVVVVDESQKMLSRVPRLPNLRTVRADIAQTGLPTNQFDAALLTDVLHHAPDAHGLLEEASRILKPGGRLLLLDFNARSIQTRLLGAFERPLFGRMNYRTPADTADLLSAHGFDVTTVSDGWCFILRGTRI